VIIPADAVAVEKLTMLIAQLYGPFYMRLTRSKSPIVHTQEQEFQIGKGIVLRDGSDCTIAACGITVKMALEAADSLNQEGISCRVIDLFSIKPIDTDLIEKAARDTGNIVTCEEHNIMAGFGSAISEVICEKYPVPMRRIGVRDQFGESARDSEISLLLQKHGITSIHISNAVKDIRSRK
jgi:transketolase